MTTISDVPSETRSILVKAAERLQATSEASREILENINLAVQTQDASASRMKEAAGTLHDSLELQANHWNGFVGEMEKLQDALTGGMDGFAERLPSAIDRTLVHFDEALGEGVERLGSAVERLRESMDDLQEQLEVMLEAKRRR